jgi:hypothetical protein
LTGDYDVENIENIFSGYLYPDEYDFSGGTALTDDRNPVEYLVAQTLDSR